jgi:triosephosphate isomerase
MARKFFVGGNFKMNPASREQKKAIVKILNEAELDEAVGESHNGIISIFVYCSSGFRRARA